ncbi:STAS/SEC14 domain-containing protein [Marinifilum caeruleilacunae]|uniref:STAS/SEC14 domain-containing protein n=1 Tax=Marinifilum caeruleilacunae TaxID=2499076 RepID=A0ABX1WUS8_9BACT|nr:hypothetical protein [Marinifilum caeruleilacunae]NOU59782.1 hypothetical protein [Marinifilum caeruleilacunae]
MKYIRYSYLKNEKQLIIACSGKIIRTELIAEFQQMFSLLDIKTNVDVLIDVKNVNLKASIEASKIYTDFFNDDKLYRYINKIAVLADSPDQVVQTMLFMDGVKHLGTSIKIFSMESSATDWLNRKTDQQKTLSVHKALSKLVLRKAS